MERRAPSGRVIWSKAGRPRLAPVWPSKAGCPRLALPLMERRVPCRACDLEQSWLSPFGPLGLSPLAPVLRGEGPGVRGESLAQLPLTPNPSPRSTGERGTSVLCYHAPNSGCLLPGGGERAGGQRESLAQLPLTPNPSPRSTGERGTSVLCYHAPNSGCLVPGAWERYHDTKAEVLCGGGEKIECRTVQGASSGESSKYV